MNYEALRVFADTWGLLLLIILFLLMLVFIFRRGSTKKYEEAARIPMEASEHPENERKAAQPGDTSEKKGN